MKIKIHPKIKELQLRANKLAIEYKIEDDVMAAFNHMAFISNENCTLSKLDYLLDLTINNLSILLSKKDEELVDFIYERYNFYHKLNN